jgi:hypothetical protein
MDARFAKWLVVAAFCPALMGAAPGYRTENFIIHAPTPDMSEQIGKAAEHFRKQLAIDWLGYELPRWSAPCPVKVKVGQIGAGGATTFSFYPNGQGAAEVANWDMNIQGSLERILDSVLPHEISHTIFACHFRRPLPRWADEGAATIAEHDSEKRRQVITVTQVIGTTNRIPLKNLLNIKEYPARMQDVMTLYAEGYSLAELLVQEGGRSRYLKFIADAHREGWDKAIRSNYKYQSVDDLERRWHQWVIAGSPELDLPKGQMLADNSHGNTQKRRGAAQGEMIIRGQSPVEDPFLNEGTKELAAAKQPGRPEKLQAPPPRSRPLPVDRSAVAASRNARPATPAGADRNVIAANTSSLSESLLPDDEPGEASPQNSSANESADSETDNAIASELAEEKEVEQTPPPRPAPRPAKKPARKVRPDVPAVSDLKVAEARTPSTRRQATEWSEFPPDPRPSPLILPRRGPLSDRR